MVRSRAYGSFAEFEREEIRPGFRIGWSVDELEESTSDDELDFDADPFEAGLWEVADEAYDDEEADEEE